MREITLGPADAGIQSVRLEDIRGGEPAENAARLVDVLSGEDGPIRETVVLNAAAAIWISGLAPDMRRGGEVARSMLDSGQALAKLRKLVTLTSGDEGGTQ